MIYAYKIAYLLKNNWECSYSSYSCSCHEELIWTKPGISKIKYMYDTETVYTKFDTEEAYDIQEGLEWEDDTEPIEKLWAIYDEE